MSAPLLLHYMCSENWWTVKELLVLECEKKSSKNKELLELGFELGSNWNGRGVKGESSDRKIPDELLTGFRDPEVFQQL